jgi:polysaccharide pyruvyl transferase WcaK-like protein
MKIGILTYYRVANFGANLQAVSTYCYLKNLGHTPIFIHYMPKELYEFTNDKSNVQKRQHLSFIDNTMLDSQTTLIHDGSKIEGLIAEYGIEALIVGSDALLQHHPLLERIKRGRIKPFYIQKINSDRMFPNAFWGCGMTADIPMAMMSVSSQNSRYQLFSSSLKRRMKQALSKFGYISVRDEWTRDLVYSITKKEVPVTPDPVFAFNQNCRELLDNSENIREKYGVPEKYILVSLASQCLSLAQLEELKTYYEERDIHCVALPMPTGLSFKHPFDYEIKIPLNPLDWYRLIRDSEAYIGSNMHPIVVSLHNGVPCFCIDQWINTNFWGRPVNDGSGKVEHILKVFGVSNCRCNLENGKCSASIQTIVGALETFPASKVKMQAEKYYAVYRDMMCDILTYFNHENSI